MAEYDEELAELRAKHPNLNDSDATYAYCHFHGKWAEALTESQPLAAIEHYRQAEEFQCTIGSYATGAGEGLQSMGELYQLRTARAEIEESLALAGQDPAEKRRYYEQALATWESIASSPHTFFEEVANAKEKVEECRQTIARLGR